MDDFKNFLKENNYEGDLGFQLCDLELAFNEGKKLRWKPSENELEVLKLAAEKDGACLMGLYEQLKKLREE